MQAQAAWVVDEARALPAEMEEQFEQELQALRDDTGIGLWVRALTFSDPGSNVRQTTLKARRQLSLDPLAALILVDRSSENIGVSYAPGVWQRYLPADLMRVGNEARRQAQEAGDDLPTRVRTAVTVMDRGLRQLEADRAASAGAPTAPELKIAGILALLLAAIALAGWWAARRWKGNPQHAVMRYFFPDAEVSHRLGAPFGGGVIVESADT